MKVTSSISLGLALSMMCTVLSSGQSKRSITPSDCVTVRYLVEGGKHKAIEINPQGSRVAYLVKAPNITANENEIELYVKDLAEEAPHSGHMVASGKELAQLHWLRDGRHLTILRRVHSNVAIVMIDSETGTQQTIVQSNSDIKEYSIDENADTAVYAIDRPATSPPTRQSVPDAARGYLISQQRTFASRLPTREVFVVRRHGSGRWHDPAPVIVHSPFSGRALPELSYFSTSGLRLSLSPNGRLLLLTYITDDPLPADWVASRAARHLFDAGIPTPILALQNLDTDESSIALKTYLPLSLPLWNPDGRSFAVVAMSPVGSVWEHEDSATPGALGHLFAVNLQPETVDQIVSHVANNGEQPLTWTQNGTLTVHTSADTIASFSFENGRWRSTSSYRIPLDDMYRLAQLASDGKQLVGDYQNLSTPPELFQWLLGERSIKTLVRLNPEFDSLALAPSMSVQWKTSTGYDINGILLLPPGYSDKNQYPLVIQTKPYVGQFLCDTGVSHFPSFAPQPIADAGMLYLIRSYPEDINNDPDAGHYPKGYPGGVGEAVFNMDVWDSAIAALNARGIIQMDKLGIIGFSRSGWYTEYILAHSGVRYRAATVTDNIQYSIGEYWTSRGSLVQPLEGMYGGPPYGKTFANWLDYSISFNLDKVRTPLLMEQMGGGVPFVSERSIPAQLIPSLEIFMGLQRLKRPVELYYYPNEDHQPDNPQARLASLQRNVDWYRFWLQGYERPNPENPEQYIRWSALRSLH